MDGTVLAVLAAYQNSLVSPQNDDVTSGLMFPDSNVGIACWQAVTGCFYRGKPDPFANRAPSWIFKTRGPRDGRVSAKINYRSPRSSSSRIFQNGGQDSELRVFSPKKNSNAYR